LNEGDPVSKSNGVFLYLYLNKRENLKRALAGELVSETISMPSWLFLFKWIAIGALAVYMLLFPIIYLFKLGWSDIVSKWPPIFHAKPFVSSLFSPLLLAIFIVRMVIIGGVLLFFTVYKLVEGFFTPIEM